MDELSADEARRNWRELLERAHFRGEHVGITRNGQPWVVVVSREWYEQAKASINDTEEQQQ